MQVCHSALGVEPQLFTASPWLNPMCLSWQCVNSAILTINMLKSYRKQVYRTVKWTNCFSLINASISLLMMTSPDCTSLVPVDQPIPTVCRFIIVLYQTKNIGVIQKLQEFHRQIHSGAVICVQGRVETEHTSGGHR
ncbi:hypothetical protein ILYODFUR_017168 [Ilyodon furcidens]|uniref:Uncharacterized protein n=1 Tax=Ilyodon furcidens TaxID=33524 RepID=A0ABV0U633_9TELE